jgi:hypothetical protein
MGFFSSCFNAVLRRIVGSIKISLSLKIKWKSALSELWIHNTRKRAGILIKDKSTVCFRDLAKLNLTMVFRF